MIPQDTIHANVQHYYGEALQGSADLRTDACCTTDSIPEHLKPLLADIHPEVSGRYYGCGYRLFKLPGLEPDSEDYSQSVAYRGTLPLHPGDWTLDAQHRFPTGKVVAVCGNTFRMLAETRLRPHFDRHAGGGRHLGIFDGCDTALPFAAQDGGQAASGGCC